MNANNNNSKFTIKSDNQYDEENMTSLDVIYKQLSDETYNIDKDSINNLSNYVKLQQFDTESMKVDLDLNGTSGNIAISISLHCTDALIKMFAISQGIFIYMHIMFQLYMFYHFTPWIISLSSLFSYCWII